MITREQVEERINSFGLPLENMFIITGPGDSGGIVLWFPGEEKVTATKFD
jgi:hypothetical protein